MHNIYVKDVTQKCHGKLIQGALDTPLISFSKDTRTIQKKSIPITPGMQHKDHLLLMENQADRGASARGEAHRVPG